MQIYEFTKQGYFELTDEAKKMIIEKKLYKKTPYATFEYLYQRANSGNKFSAYVILHLVEQWFFDNKDLILLSQIYDKK